MCTQQFSSKTDLKQHYQEVHKNRADKNQSRVERKYNRYQISDHHACNVCSEKFETKPQLQKHKKTAHKKVTSFSCEEYSSVYTSRQSLKEHVQSVHEGIKKVCSNCLKPVLDLTRHIRNQHKNEEQRNFHCDICDTNFRTNYILVRHKEIKHLKVKAWSCDLCDKQFGEKRDMIRHKNAIHFKIKNIQCIFILRYKQLIN